MSTTEKQVLQISKAKFQKQQSYPEVYLELYGALLRRGLFSKHTSAIRAANAFIYFILFNYHCWCKNAIHSRFFDIPEGTTVGVKEKKAVGDFVLNLSEKEAYLATTSP